MSHTIVSSKIWHSSSTEAEDRVAIRSCAYRLRIFLQVREERSLRPSWRSRRTSASRAAALRSSELASTSRLRDLHTRSTSQVLFTRRVGIIRFRFNIPGIPRSHSACSCKFTVYAASCSEDLSVFARAACGAHIAQMKSTLLICQSTLHRAGTTQIVSRSPESRLLSAVELLVMVVSWWWPPGCGSRKALRSTASLQRSLAAIFSAGSALPRLAGFLLTLGP